MYSHTMKALLHRPRIKLSMLCSVQVFENLKHMQEPPSTRFVALKRTHVCVCVRAQQKTGNPGIMNYSCQGFQSPQMVIVQNAEALTRATDCQATGSHP